VANYKYIFMTLIADQVIEEIDMFGANAIRQLSSPGQFNGSFVFDQTGKLNIDLVAATTPGRTWMVMEREGVPVWWGIIWSRTYQSQAKECQIFAWGFEAYPQRQKMVTDFTRVNEPNAQIFTELWVDMQSVAGRNLGIDIPTVTYGTTASLSVLSTDEKYYSDAMDSLANGTTGFDWTIDVTKNMDGSYNKSLRVGYPTLGIDHSDPGAYVFEYPGNIMNYYQTESMADAGTNVFTLGAGEGSDMLVVQTTQKTMIDQGWPRWDVDAAYKDIADPALLTSIANQQKIMRKPPMPAYVVTLKGDQDPVFGSYNVGDASTLCITDARNPSPDGNTAGLEVPTTVLGYQINPSNSQGVEQIDLILPGDVNNG
jgi:hypothetical protein